MSQTVRYNNRFFKTIEEAKEFKKKIGAGRILKWNPKGRNSRLEFAVEMQVALDARGESVDPEITPFCVAWNEIMK